MFARVGNVVDSTVVDRQMCVDNAEMYRIRLYYIFAVKLCQHSADRRCPTMPYATSPLLSVDSSTVTIADDAS